ncbi:DNA ligase D [Bacillus sp. EB600]|uniref:DNA ligase D n=1 Tax=Bacillus sp. EB600 TaxID=2806345 RepID=UPI00210EE615|nr:DNA ligase D [Bacillus sp. EB600]MCQ6277770.1 DNA ligase D [Bacillus sp. EB600]
MKPMLPSLTFDRPEHPDWLYEVKYDGFRAILDWKHPAIRLTSRNEKTLLAQFPEIEEFLVQFEEQFRPFLPLRLDGELVSLTNPYKGNFSTLQVRGRLRSEKKIHEQANHSPCRLMVFDVLMLSGTNLQSAPFLERKEQLINMFQQIGLNLDPDPANRQLLQIVKAYPRFSDIWEKVVLYDGEGIVAKHKNSLWEEGKRSTQWLKYKNWKYVSCFITAFDKTNGYFSLGVYQDKKIQAIGQVLFGLKPDEKQVLQQIVKQNNIGEDTRFIFVEPAICLEVKYLELYENELREPHFDRFRLDLKPYDCTFDRFISQKQNLPESVEITHPDKPLWDQLRIKKSDYIHYLREVSPYMLPFLKNRLLTVIRFPHGMLGEPFYQKNCPDYAPEFVNSHSDDGIDYIVCNNLNTLIWLGNQLAIEFHIPFQTIDNNGPSEIVLDLDPPSREDFHLAIKAALNIKDVLEQLQLISFVKTSGNKGIQVYIPLPDHEYTYEDTRLFTNFIANYLVSHDPDSFTIERLKKNRGHRLYVDYVQHSEGKTIVAPYSMRGNEHAGVATPLFWDEVNVKLDVKSFTMQTALTRIKNRVDPFKNYFQTKQIQPFKPVLEFLKQTKKG